MDKSLVPCFLTHGVHRFAEQKGNGKRRIGSLLGLKGSKFDHGTASTSCEGQGRFYGGTRGAAAPQ